MSITGQNYRILCDAKCILNFAGVDYQGVIENISLSGALIKLDKIPDNMNPGDKCGLLLCSNPDFCPVNYTCKVSRLDSGIIGVQFMEIN